MKACITLLEANAKFRTILPGEPQMGRRGLYPTTSVKRGAGDVRNMMNVLAYCDGDHDVIDLCERTGLPWNEILSTLKTLAAAGVVTSEA
jgi:aminopeptidase-like protein